MTKQIDRQIFRLMSCAIALFFIFAILKYIIFDETTIVNFIINIAGIVILLNILGILGNQLIKKIRQEVVSEKKLLELEIDLLSKHNNELEQKIALIKESEIKQFDDKTKEAELQKIISEFLNSNKSYEMLSYISKNYDGMVAILYIKNELDGIFTIKEKIGLSEDCNPQPFTIGEGLNGQAVQNGKPIVIKEIPEDFFEVSSGLGKAKPKYLYLLPIMQNENCLALIELATFQQNELDVIWVNSFNIF